MLVTLFPDTMLSLTQSHQFPLILAIILPPSLRLLLIPIPIRQAQVESDHVEFICIKRLIDFELVKFHPFNQII